MLSFGAEPFVFQFAIKNLKIKIYRTIILPVVLYGCETWSLILREKCRLRVFENRVLRRIFWPRRDEVTGEWRKLHNEELNNLHSSPNIVQVIKLRRMRWGRGELYTLFWWGNLGGKIPLGRPRHRWDDNIKMELQEVGCGCDWIKLSQDKDRWWALVNAVMDLWVPLNSRNFLTSWKRVSFPRSTLLHEVSKLVSK